MFNVECSCNEQKERETQIPITQNFQVCSCGNIQRDLKYALVGIFKETWSMLLWKYSRRLEACSCGNIQGDLKYALVGIFKETWSMLLWEYLRRLEVSMLLWEYSRRLEVCSCGSSCQLYHEARQTEYKMTTLAQSYGGCVSIMAYK